MNLAVTVLHNVSDRMFTDFDPSTSKLYHAHTFQVIADGMEQACNLIWELTNVDGPEMLPNHLSLYGNQVREDRSRMNRSLSVGDVLRIEDLGRDGEPLTLGWRAVASLGWTIVVPAPLYIRGTNASPMSQSYLAHEERYRLSRRS